MDLRQYNTILELLKEDEKLRYIRDKLSVGEAVMYGSLPAAVKDGSNIYNKWVKRNTDEINKTINKDWKPRYDWGRKSRRF